MQMRSSSAWPEMTSALVQHNLRNMTLYKKNIKGFNEPPSPVFFSHMEYIGSDFDQDMNNLISSNKDAKEWLALWGGEQTAEGRFNFPELEEIYHDGQEGVYDVPK